MRTVITIDGSATPERTGAPAYEVGPLDRALDVLEELAQHDEIALVDLAAAVGLSKSTAFRHLKVLERRGYVTQDRDTKRYRLGYGVLQLGYRARSSLQLPRVAAEGMAALAAEFNETVHLGALTGSSVVHIAVLPSTHALKMAAEVGERAAVHVSSLGKCLVAWGGDELVDRIVTEVGLPAETPYTVTTRAGLVAELDRVRAQGYAVDDQESLIGLRCLGVPVRAAGGNVVGAISLSGPLDRMQPPVLDAMISRLLEVGVEVSRQCGWSVDGGARDRRRRA